jgi:glycosyltransferase involved in cell wall biosynthesis
MSSDAIKNVYIVTDEPFPIGMAATNRIISISKGFIENHAKVKVICFRTTESEENGVVNKEPHGTYNGIAFEYSCGTTTRGKSFLGRRLLLFQGIAKALLMLREMEKKDVLMIYLSEPLFIILFYVGAKIFKLIYVIDKSEYPFVLHNKSLIGRIYAHYYTSWMYKLFDVVLVMTKPLEVYFQSRICKNAKLFLMPMTVESSRFMNNSVPHREKGRYIAYCGYLGGNKDGVSILIQSFGLISKQFSDVKLYIIGDSPDTDDLSKLKKLSQELDLTDRIIFTGRIGRDDIPGYLIHASILALARPSSLQSEGGFPSKLGEYLSTGNTVVVTSVGDIPFFLKDGENAFLSVPDSAEAFAQKLDYALTHPEHARQVGLRGRETALANFDYKLQSKRLVEFLSTMRSN